MLNPVNIFFVLVLIVLAIMLYHSFQKRQVANELQSDPFHIIKKYLLTEPDELRNREKRNRPNLWIHVPFDYNARNWESWGSRSSHKLNQPYLYLLVRTIVAKCDRSFNICMIDDNSFARLLPTWSVDMGRISAPISDNVRTIGLLKLVHTYGGMVCPISFLCMRDLIGLYEEGTRGGKTAFICENVSRNINSTHREFAPDMTMFGAEKGSPIIADLCEYVGRISGRDFTAQSVFVGNFSRWWKIRAERKGDVVIIGATAIGRKTLTTGEPILIDHMLGSNYLDVDTKAIYGIYVPADEILSRRNYEWFARMSPRQIMDSNTILGNYILLTAVPGGREEEPMFLEPFSQKDEILKRRQWVGFWKTPLINGLWGQKPNFLGDNLLTLPHPGP